MRKIKLIFMIISVFCFSSAIFSQSKDISKLDWLSVGVGTGIQGHGSGFINYTFVDENSYQLKLNTDFNVSFFGHSSDYFYTGSFSYGLTDISKWFFGGVFIGPSVSYTTNNGSKKEFGIGVDLNTQCYFAALDVLGFGIDLYGNINTIKTIYGIRFSFFFKSIK